jgi:hypothetical protein
VALAMSTAFFSMATMDVATTTIEPQWHQQR